MIPLIFSAVNDASENFENLSNDLCIVFFLFFFSIWALPVNGLLNGKFLWHIQTSWRRNHFLRETAIQSDPVLSFWKSPVIKKFQRTLEWVTLEGTLEWVTLEGTLEEALKWEN